MIWTHHYEDKNVDISCLGEAIVQLFPEFKKKDIEEKKNCMPIVEEIDETLVLKNTVQLVPGAETSKGGSIEENASLVHGCVLKSLSGEEGNDATISLAEGELPTNPPTIAS